MRIRIETVAAKSAMWVVWDEIQLAAQGIVNAAKKAIARKESQIKKLKHKLS